jgi:DNA-binding XRE family transcriptional regulator
MSIVLRKSRDINEARHRRISIPLMAKRAGITKVTLGKIEKGNPTISIAGYASVLFVLRLTDKLRDIADANNDLTGRILETENLPKRIHTQSISLCFNIIIITK